MALPDGSHLGPYEIIGAIGAGGMGEVYRARDTKLGREVALKVLPDLFARDPDRLARFRREAQVLASLNHPNIAQLYGFEDTHSSHSPGAGHGGSGQGAATHALVMELVEGRTLAELIQLSGPAPLPVDQALSIARQVAEALEAAHEQGIIHRDLKPANIKVRADGTTKVLDFGLAKALDRAAASSGSGPAFGTGNLKDSPTMMSPAVTEIGAIIGTAAYMSPEQARGRTVDKRADIWAFGCLLYEMLTGRAACGGNSVADTLSAIVRDEPDWTRIPRGVGPRIQALLRRCLQKDPRQRLRDIGDGRLVLDEAIATGDPAEAKPAAAQETLSWAFSIPVPPSHWVPLDEAPVLALSRDARVCVFVAVSREGRQLFRRDLARLTATPIAGSDGASGPFLSPDARWVGFFSAGWLKRVSVDGGVATSLCEVSTLPRGGCWAPDGRIVFSPVPDGPLMCVPDAGGVPEALTRLDVARNERTHRWPAVLSNGEGVLFTIGTTLNTQDYDGSEIALARLDTGQSRVVFRGGRMARAADQGEMLVQRRSTLMRAPLDPAAGAARAAASQTLMEGVAGDASSGSGYFATAGRVLAYAPVSSVAERLSLFLVDRTGQTTLLPAPPRGYRYPRVSPDGRHIACHISDDRELDAQGTRGDIWILDLDSRRLARLTTGAVNSFPCWSPDGRRVAFYRAGNPAGVYERLATGGRADTPIWATPVGLKLPEAWHPDGTVLAVPSFDRPVGLWRVPVNGDEPTRFGPDLGDHWGSSFSPDGNYLAYTSMESGVAEVFVEALSGDRGRWQVSTDGGMFPLWSHDGRELVYVCGDSLMTVDIEAGPTLQLGLPEVLFRTPFELRMPPSRNFDIFPDGRFVMVGRADDAAERPGFCVMSNP